jgi:threonine/homoserine/homoserine lactone efflux protein
MWAGHKCGRCSEKAFRFAALFMLLQGILFGISLSFLIGPLLFAVVEAGIGQGFRAGISVAAGIWVSDVLFVGAILWSVDTLAAITQIDGFKQSVGAFGGVLLLAFGAGSFFSNSGQKARTALAEEGIKKRSYLAWWLRGFLLNTVNPGTIFFWIGIISAVVVPNHWDKQETLVFFGGMLGTLVITDTLKAWAAKRIRQFLTPKHIRQVQRGIGLMLMVFGVVLIGRVLIA